MKVTRCVPLVGHGVIARSGGLVAVTEGGGPGPDPLLSALTEVAAAAGDGSDLVLRAARAALGGDGQPAWACAGVTADDGVAVLVHGHAMAAVRVGDGPEVMLTASDSVIPVSRKFTGAAITVCLSIGDPAPPDPQFWLGDGVVCGGGLAVTVSADAAEVAASSDCPTVVPQEPPTVLDMDAVGAVEGRRTPTLDTPVFGTPTTGWQAEGMVADDPPPVVVVDGVLCPREHFNDPSARACRQCGIDLDHCAQDLQRRQRPPLGVMLLDDGTRFTLDRNYVLGREPTFDSDVIDGRAKPLRINDPDGTVSRLHLRISLAGWLVEVSDLGSANGSVLRSSGEERELTPFVPTAIEPGARIGIGHRSMQYLAYQGVVP